MCGKAICTFKLLWQVIDYFFVYLDSLVYFNQAKPLYCLLVNESFDKFKYFLYKMESLKVVCLEVDDGGTCMVCPHVRFFMLIKLA